MEVVGEEYGLGGNYRRVEPPALQLGTVAEGEDRDSAVGVHPQRGVAAGVYAQQLGVAGRQGEFGAWGDGGGQEKRCGHLHEKDQHQHDDGGHGRGPKRHDRSRQEVDPAPSAGQGGDV